LHYFIKQEADNSALLDFRVSPHGHIYVSGQKLDRETLAVYTFTCIASDTGQPSALSGSVQVQIHLTDVNDNAPIWQFPGDRDREVNVSILEMVGHRIALLRAVDADEGENGQVEYILKQINHQSLSASRSSLAKPTNSFSSPSMNYNQGEGMVLNRTSATGEKLADSLKERSGDESYVPQATAAKQKQRQGIGDFQNSLIQSLEYDLSQAASSSDSIPSIHDEQSAFSNIGEEMLPSDLVVFNTNSLFELDPTTGALYIGRSLHSSDVGSAKLIIEARDRGNPVRRNPRVLRVNLLPWRMSTDSGLGQATSVKRTGGIIESGGKEGSILGNNGGLQN
ncbi:unnamed protein product, partial [Protopolystoma xenopodis]